MKKNLRIVSAAAAALLAVAPIAASAVSTVNAAALQQISLAHPTASTKGSINLTSNLKAVTYPGKTTTNNNTGATKDYDWNGDVNGNVTTTYNGQTYIINYTEVAGIFGRKGDTFTPIKPVVEDGKTVYHLHPGEAYYVGVNGASINMSTANANIPFATLGSNNGEVLYSPAGANKWSTNLDVATNINGGVYVTNKDTKANLGNTFDMLVKVVPTDMTNAESVTFTEKATNNVVTTGSLNMSVGVNQTMNVSQILGAFNQKYLAHQIEGKTNSYAELTTNTDDIKAQLEKEGMTVDSNGNFLPNANFSLNFTAKSPANGATATLPVTVTVQGGKVTTPSTVDSVTKTIMHNAYYYNKDAQRVGTDKITRYNSVTVLPTTTTINGKAYYQVVENGKAVDKYINADNIDGTKRTLKHNAYVYATSKKRANKVTLKKGDVVTTYGAAYKFANGKMYYKIGNDTNKTYVKVANF